MSQTYIAQKEKTHPGCKMRKERVTLVGGNACGDKKLKLLVTHENPRSMKNVTKSRLPVILKSSRKASMTSAMFKEWFESYFVHEVHHYC